MTEITDQEAIRRVLAGEREVFGVLVGRHRDRGFRYAMHLLGNAEDAEDALQESFLRAFRSLRRCRDPERFQSWFFRILVNRCRTSGGRRKVRGEREMVLVVDPPASTATSPTADDLAWRESIREALGRLPVDQREAFLLRHVEGVGYEEMRALTGTGVSALKMRVKRACDMLRAHLRDMDHAD